MTTINFIFSKCINVHFLSGDGCCIDSFMEKTSTDLSLSCIRYYVDMYHLSIIDIIGKCWSIYQQILELSATGLYH